MVVRFHKAFSQINFPFELVRQQAIARNVIHAFILVFVFIGKELGWIGELNDDVVVFGSSFILLSLVITAVVVSFPRTARFCTIAGMLLDAAIIALLMIKGGDKEAALYGILLFMIIANGIRFGRTYLLITNIVCIISFSVIIAYSPFWQQYPTFSYAFMVWLVALPAYIAVLLRRLEVAIEKAEGVNKAKTLFIANMSHEIRTPLASIIGFSEAAQEKGLSEEERLSHLSTINRSAQHLLCLVNDILDFSKIDAEKMDIEVVSFSLPDLLNEIDAMMAPQAQQKGLKFSLRCEHVIPKYIISDPVRIKQILINLCSNAVKFTSEGKIEIDVVYSRETGMLSIGIVDTGIGMTEEQIQRAFQMFTQADSTTTRQYGGTGLGLSLSKSLAIMLHGTLTIESELNKGSRFTFSFKPEVLEGAELVALYDSNLEKIGVDERIVDEAKLKGSVLLAEDNEANQQLFALFFQKAGLEVTVANNGQEAYELGIKGNFSLIIIDMQMPIMSGVEAVKLLREGGVTTPIIAFTANATNEDKTACFEAGCNDFLTKPVSRRRLMEVVAKTLKSP